jgi:hypothetical protein
LYKADFPRQAYLTTICHLWKLTTSWQRWNFTNSGHLSVSLTVGTCETSQRNYHCFLYI